MKHSKRTRAEYQSCADAGMTRAECAKYLGVRLAAVTNISSRCKIKFADGINNHNCKPMEFEGVLYPSQTAAAKAAGVARPSLMARKGPIVRKVIVPMPVVRVSASVRAIARALVSHGART